MINIVSEPFHELIKIENAVTDEKDCFDKFLDGLTKSKKELVSHAIRLYLAQVANRQSGCLVRNAYDIHRHMAPLLCDLQVEEFWVIMLNQDSRVVATEKLFSGGITGTAVDVRVLFQRLLKTPRVTSFAVVHNHPSGNIRPSRDDDEITRQIQKGAEVLDLRFLDHVIYAVGAYYSYCESGKL